jgi:extracellular factor (EF) 3-hydroxypalmitic acid methyl ester biosynthesis protein
MATTAASIKDNLVICRSNQGVEIRASLLRLTRFQAVFEIYDPNLVLRTSEVLSDFQVISNERTLYSGKAVVSSLVNAGTMLVCEAKLDEAGLNLAAFTGADSPRLADGFHAFLGEWQKVYQVLPEFKVVVADMQTFLADLRLWLGQVELEIRSAPSGNRVEAERATAQEIGASIVPAFDAMHERLEELSERIEPERRPAHQTFAKRQLHPLVLCSPFAHRTFQKPLGYAGDYEMVNMIIRDPHEGSSLFAKVVNLWFIIVCASFWDRLFLTLLM